MPSLPIHSTNFDDSGDSVDGSDRISVIRDLHLSYITVSKMHMQEEWLRSLLKATKVVLASAHGERVVA